MNTQFKKLNPEQQEAIALYAQEKGRKWKSQLLDEWMVASYRWNHPGKSCLLQQVRNQFGPTWLKKVRLPTTSQKC